MASEKKRKAVRLSVPITCSTIFLARETLGTNIEPWIITTVRLIQMKYIETNGLLRRNITFDLDVPSTPNLRPSFRVISLELLEATDRGLSGRRLRARHNGFRLHL